MADRRSRKGGRKGWPESDKGGRGHASDRTKVAVCCWSGQWRVVVGSGPRRHTAKAPNEREARRLADALQRDLDDGVLDEPDGRPQTVGAVLDAFLRRKRRDGRVRTTTLTDYGNQIKALKKGMGLANMTGLDRRTVVAYVKARVAAGRSGATVRGEINVLRMALKYAVERGWWHGDGTRLTACLGDIPETQEKAWLRVDEARALLEHLDMDAFGMAARMALLAGMRAGEVTSRQWSDVDFSSGMIFIGPKQTRTWTWKTKSGRKRWVPMNADLRDALRRWYLKQGRPNDNAWVIPTSDNQRRSTLGWFRRKLQVACDAAGVRRCSFHGLRHTFTALSIEAGVPVFEVSKILGHHSVEFTTRAYGHVDDRRLSAAVDQLGLSLKGRPNGQAEGSHG